MPVAEERIMTVTDLLLGAVYADDSLKGEEEATVRKLLLELLAADELPAEVDSRIKTFPAGTFDMATAAADFSSDPPIHKRRLLELVVAVRDADDEVDLAEDEYLHTLAEALGVAREEYADLALDYEVEELRAGLEQLAKKPPPIPSDAG